MLHQLPVSIETMKVYTETNVKRRFDYGCIVLYSVKELYFGKPKIFGITMIDQIALLMCSISVLYFPPLVPVDTMCT